MHRSVVRQNPSAREEDYLVRAFGPFCLSGRAIWICRRNAARCPGNDVPITARRYGAGLNKIKGFSCRVPHGAFYVFPNITKTGWPSKKLADALLEDAGVAGLSGTAFGSFGEGYLRFSVANSIENIE